MNHQLSNKEILVCLSQLDESSNLWRALQSMIQHQIDAELLNCQSGTSPDGRAFNDGRMNMILEFRDDLNKKLAEARKLR